MLDDTIRLLDAAGGGENAYRGTVRRLLTSLQAIDSEGDSGDLEGIDCIRPLRATIDGAGVLALTP